MLHIYSHNLKIIIIDRSVATFFFFLRIETALARHVVKSFAFEGEIDVITSQIRASCFSASFPGYTLAFPKRYSKLVGTYLTPGWRGRHRILQAGRMAAGRATKLFASLLSFFSATHPLASSGSSPPSSFSLSDLEDPRRSFVEAFFSSRRFLEISRRLARFIFPVVEPGTSTSAEELWGNVSRKSTIYTRPN